jgi:hypothetical protein
MVDWGTSSFQIITAVIGSGVLLFILNTANTGFNQPHIKIEGSNPSQNQNQTNMRVHMCVYGVSHISPDTHIPPSLVSVSSDLILLI